MIEVINLHEERGSGIYVGRPSVLGNPWVVFRDGTREEVVEKFRQWLWGIVQEKALTPNPLPSDGRGRESGEPTSEELRHVRECQVRLRLGDGRYRELVWAAICGLVTRVERGEEVRLLCYCKPRACHGEVIARCVEWLVRVRSGECGVRSEAVQASVEIGVME